MQLRRKKKNEATKNNKFNGMKSLHAETLTTRMAWPDANPRLEWVITLLVEKEKEFGLILQSL